MIGDVMSPDAHASTPQDMKRRQGEPRTLPPVDSLHETATLPPTMSEPAGEPRAFPAIPGYEVLAEIGRGGMGWFTRRAILG
jgi:hypothetical protein